MGVERHVVIACEAASIATIHYTTTCCWCSVDGSGYELMGIDREIYDLAIVRN
jgi:hypothetical protein